MPVDYRQTAQAHVDALVAKLRSSADQKAVLPLIEECEALSRAIAAFHMEGIRFRMFNVDRLLRRQAGLPAELPTLFADARRALEAAGFHTRSHQAPS
jgi:hypothetical protein